LIPWIRSHRMRTKPRAHTAIVDSCVILVIFHSALVSFGSFGVIHGIIFEAAPVFKLYY